MQQGVPLDLVGELVQLLGGRQFTVDQQVADLDEGRLLGELLDRVAAVAQDAGVAVDVGDRRLGRRGVDEAAVERRVTRLGEQRTQRDAVGSSVAWTMSRSSSPPGYRRVAVSRENGDLLATEPLLRFALYKVKVAIRYSRAEGIAIRRRSACGGLTARIRITVTPAAIRDPGWDAVKVRGEHLRCYRIRRPRGRAVAQLRSASSASTRLRLPSTVHARTARHGIRSGCARTINSGPSSTPSLSVTRSPQPVTMIADQTVRPAAAADRPVPLPSAGRAHPEPPGTGFPRLPSSAPCVELITCSVSAMPSLDSPGTGPDRTRLRTATCASLSARRGETSSGTSPSSAATALIRASNRRDRQRPWWRSTG